ncbi:MULTISPECIES: hypothetical protein [Bacillus]|uniref:Uncharacterized protein n=1 Tax=Bacillus wiedmannii TaxID=1890302 RepID=A0A1C4F4V6_9BACI|nr:MULTISPECIES: hypothetical protein [Bacillus]EOP11835.1 hypothetical protein ICS_02341 [Bacillus cereus BAG2O-3]EOQ10942.1 hypothetical protein KQ3_02546 [Bacillus cereus B5-2]MBJ8117757.1 hypothetical protein [Bacillus cereus]MBJ8084166.1 hypothetical protein [Bacillus cereus group sp. N14]MDM5268269.1 hypothetical protein [Bacillus wiedmannii]
MKRKLLSLVVPIMSLSGIACSSKDVAEEKKTDSLQVAVDYQLKPPLR